jgi:hypothetical protein
MSVGWMRLGGFAAIVPSGTRRAGRSLAAAPSRPPRAVTWAGGYVLCE